MAQNTHTAHKAQTSDEQLGRGREWKSRQTGKLDTFNWATESTGLVDEPLPPPPPPLLQQIRDKRQAQLYLSLPRFLLFKPF